MQKKCANHLKTKFSNEKEVKTDMSLVKYFQNSSWSTKKKLHNTGLFWALWNDRRKQINQSRIFNKLKDHFPSLTGSSSFQANWGSSHLYTAWLITLNLFKIKCFEKVMVWLFNDTWSTLESNQRGHTESGGWFSETDETVSVRGFEEAAGGCPVMLRGCWLLVLCLVLRA